MNLISIFASKYWWFYFSKNHSLFETRAVCIWSKLSKFDHECAYWFKCVEIGSILFKFWMYCQICSSFNIGWGLSNISFRKSWKFLLFVDRWGIEISLINVVWCLESWVQQLLKCQVSMKWFMKMLGDEGFVSHNTIIDVINPAPALGDPSL